MNVNMTMRAIAARAAELADPLVDRWDPAYIDSLKRDFFKSAAKCDYGALEADIAHIVELGGDQLKVDELLRELRQIAGERLRVADLLAFVGEEFPSARYLGEPSSD